VLAQHVERSLTPRVSVVVTCFIDLVVAVSQSVGFLCMQCLLSGNVRTGCRASRDRKAFAC
jgi:hypothetical protein